MKKLKNIRFICFLLILLSLCLIVGCQDVGRGRKMITGEGTLASKVFELGDVSSLELTDIMRVNVTSDIEVRTEVFLEYGDENSVTIQTYENILENLSVQQNGEIVIISGNERQKYKADKIAITLTLKNPEKLIFDGYYEITSSDSFTSDELLLRLGRGTTCDITYSGKALSFETAPNCTVTMWGGNTEIVSVASEGGCALDFEYLSALTADIALKDKDSCIVNACELVKVAIEGEGSLSYLGEPEIDSSLSEQASVSKANPYQDE